MRHPQHTGLFIALFGEGIVHWPTIFSVALFPIIVLGGIVLFGVVGVLVADSVEGDFSAADPGASLTGFLGATALGILAFKGFTTITNSGSELKDPHRNLGRAIMISIALCVVIYALVGFAVSSNLSLEEIIATRNYSLAAAARPALGEYAVWFTIILAMLATSGGIIASIFLGVTHAGHADRDEAGSPPPLPHAGQHPEAYAGLYDCAGITADGVFRPVPYRGAGHHPLSDHGHCHFTGVCCAT